jgi:hypothetical protein
MIAANEVLRCIVFALFFIRADTEGCDVLCSRESLFPPGQPPPLALPTSGSAQWIRGHDVAANVSGRGVLDSRVPRELWNVGRARLR